MDSLIAPIMLFVVFSSVVYYILLPFIGPQIIVAGDEQDTEAIAFELRRMSLYKQLREAEFEQQMGLVDGAEYSQIRDDLMGEVAALVQSADSKGGTTVQAAQQSSDDGCHSCGASIVDDARFCGQCGSEVGVSCPNCSGTVRPEDQFCGHCGRGMVN